MRILKEANDDQHIYIDSASGDMFIFDGKQLKKIGNQKNPTVGDRGDKDIQAQEEEERQKQIAKEKEAGEEEESEQDIEDRLKRIEKDFGDNDIGNALDDENEMAKSKEARKAKERELKKYKSNPTNKFKLDLQRFVARQIVDSRDQTWRRFNKNTSAFGIMRPGYANTPTKNIPIINVYYDQSGSWGPEDIAVGNSMLGVLNEYEKKNQIKVNVYYFAIHLETNAEVARKQGGTYAGDEILDNIQQTKPDNVIIMTDSDFDSTMHGSHKVTVPGAVWFLWKRGNQSRWLKSNLSGKQQTQSYNI